MTLELVTLNGIKLAEEAHEVLIPTPDGQIAVFPQHAELVSLVEPGVISVRLRAGDPDTKMHVYATNGGIVEINHRRIRMLVDDASDSREVVLEEAKEALQLAKKQAADANSEQSLEEALAHINTNIARIKVAGMKHRSRHY